MRVSVPAETLLRVLHALFLDLQIGLKLAQLVHALAVIGPRPSLPVPSTPWSSAIASTRLASTLLGSGVEGALLGRR